MNCQSHPGQKPYSYALGRRTTVLCDSCAASLIALGMSLRPIERREHDLPVIHERRHLPRPAWLSRADFRRKDYSDGRGAA